MKRCSEYSRHVLEQGMWRGHHITAFTHYPNALASVGGLSGIVSVDGRDLVEVSKAVRGQEAVIALLNPPGLGPGTVVSEVIGTILRAMREMGVRHLVCVSAHPLVSTRPPVLLPLVKWIFRNPYADLAMVLLDPASDGRHRREKPEGALMMNRVSRKALMIGCGIAGPALCKNRARAGMDAEIYEARASAIDYGGLFLNMAYMGKVVYDISMSLDGLITGPTPGPEQPLGVRGEWLHAWAFGRKTEGDTLVTAVLAQQKTSHVEAHRYRNFQIPRYGIICD